MELMYMNFLILLFTSSKFISIDDGSQRIQNLTWRLSWTLLLTLSWIWFMNSIVIVHDMKDTGDIVDSWIHILHSYTHLLESYNKLVEVVEGSSKGLS